MIERLLLPRGLCFTNGLTLEKIPFGSHSVDVVPPVIVPRRFTLPEAVELAAANPAVGIADLRRLVEEAQSPGSRAPAKDVRVHLEEPYRQSRSA